MGGAVVVREDQTRVHHLTPNNMWQPHAVTATGQTTEQVSDLNSALFVSKVRARDPCHFVL